MGANPLDLREENATKLYNYFHKIFVKNLKVQ